MTTIGSSVPAVPTIVAVPILAADPNPVVVAAFLAAVPNPAVVEACHPVVVPILAVVAGSRPA
jgi:hypothetical protein